MDTKEMILEAALELFSQKGFASSSVRDIAARIGIKDSSLYFHFKNKQAILDSLLDKFIGISEQMMAVLNELINAVTAIDDEHFLGITQQYIQCYFTDDFISRFIMVMNHERSHNEYLREKYLCWCIEKPITYQATVMKKLQDIGYLKTQDARQAALEYYAPVFLFFNQYMSHDFSDKEKECFQNAVMAATRNFVNAHKRGD